MRFNPQIKPYMCPTKCLGKQKLSTTKHWETELVNMSKSGKATVSFVGIS